MSTYRMAHSKQKRSAPVAISIPNGWLFKQEQDILYCQANGNYCVVFLTDGSNLLVSKKLKDVAAQLSDTFIRVHHQYVVNMYHLISFDKTDMILELKGGVRLPLSIRRKRTLSTHFRIL